MKYVHLILLTLALCSCRRGDGTASAQPERSGMLPPPGKYKTYIPSLLERLRIELTYDRKTFPLPVLLVDLRADSTYLMGYCDNQIAEAGRYTASGSAVRLYDRYDMELKRPCADKDIYFDAQRGTLFFILEGQDMRPVQRKGQVIPMRTTNTHSHLGFLRGEDQDLASLRHAYAYWPGEKQRRWTDSVLRSREAGGGSE